jgi:hypothetical protein
MGEAQQEQTTYTWISAQRKRQRGCPTAEGPDQTDAYAAKHKTQREERGISSIWFGESKTSVTNQKGETENHKEVANTRQDTDKNEQIGSGRAKRNKTKEKHKTRNKKTNNKEKRTERKRQRRRRPTAEGPDQTRPVCNKIQQNKHKTQAKGEQKTNI